jgi:uncharacterized protein (DUF2236 family)
MLRRIHRERAVALSGPRALLMQAAHPLAVAGLLTHSTALDEPYERLARTARTMHAIWFGSRAEADRAARTVRTMHRRVSGRLGSAVGPYPAGTPYRADDPELLLWVLYTLLDSALVLFRTYVGPVGRDEEAAYWEDYKVVGRLFGLRAREMPRTLDDLRAYGDAMVGGDRLFVSDWARERARRIVFEPPVPLLARPLRDTVNFVTIALLPDPIRRQYGFSAVPPPVVRRALVAVGGEYVKRGVIPFLPERLRLLPDARAA